MENVGHGGHRICWLLGRFLVAQLESCGTLATFANRCATCASQSVSLETVARTICDVVHLLTGWLGIKNPNKCSVQTWTLDLGSSPKTTCKCCHKFAFRIEARLSRSWRCPVGPGQNGDTLDSSTFEGRNDLAPVLATTVLKRCWSCARCNAHHPNS